MIDDDDDDDIMMMIMMRKQSWESKKGKIEIEERNNS